MAKKEQNLEIGSEQNCLDLQSLFIRKEKPKGERKVYEYQCIVNEPFTLSLPIKTEHQLSAFLWVPLLWRWKEKLQGIQASP